MNFGPESMVVLTCSLFIGNEKKWKHGELKTFCLWRLFFRAVMSLPVLVSWSHKMSEVINGQQSDYGNFKDTGIMENFSFRSICHQWWL